MTNSGPADTLPVKECAVPAFEILDLIPITIGNEFCMASRDVKAGQQQIRATATPDDNLRDGDEKLLRPPVLGLPFQTRSVHARTRMERTGDVTTDFPAVTISMLK